MLIFTQTNRACSHGRVLLQMWTVLSARALAGSEPALQREARRGKLKSGYTETYIS